MKKILVISDTHCGSMYGLTPPSWIISKERDARVSKLQEGMWEAYTTWLEEIGPVDILIGNGDLIDGKGDRAGGVELLTTDMITQADIAIECLSLIDCKQVFCTHGTRYHVSNGGDDYERIIAGALGGSISDHLKLVVEGVKFDVRHHAGSSSVPYGRFAPIAKNRFWDLILAEKSKTEPANVYLRSHVHYYNFCGGSDWCAFSLPAMQAPFTSYGKRICTGDTDYGLMVFEVSDGKLDGWQLKTKQLDYTEEEVIIIE